LYPYNFLIEEELSIKLSNKEILVASETFV